MAYDNQCGSCANFEDKKGRGPYDKRNPNYIKGYCTWYGSYYYPDNTCVDEGDHYRYRGYITTMVCSRLGLGKEDEVYKTIIGYQKNVMEKDDKYTNLLKDYDDIGPKISKELETEDITIIQAIYDRFLTPVANLINNEKEDQAVFKYKHMVEILRGHYHINRENKSNKKTTNKMKVLAVKKNV